MGKKLFAIVSMFAVLALLVSCAPATPQVVEKIVKETVVVEKEVAVEKQVVQTVVVEKEKTVIVEKSAARTGDTLVIDLYAAWTNLDPAIIADFPGLMLIGNMCEGLTSIDPTNPTGPVGPGLAESWEKSADGKVWTFKLRQGVKFHDGTPFDAEAVKFSFERVMDENHPFYNTKMASWRTTVFALVKTVEVVDANTVKMTLNDPPHPNFDFMLAVMKIVSPTQVQKVGKEGFETAAVCTGPFALYKYDQTNKIIDLRRFKDYWQEGIPKVERLVWRLVAEGAVRIAELETGQADIITNVPVDEVARLEANPDVKVLNIPSSMFQGIFFYHQKDPWKDVRVRQAIAYAIDRDLMAKTVYAGKWDPAKGPLLPYTAGWDANYKSYPYDPEKAKQLLAEAGVATPFKTKLSMPATSGMNPAGQRWAEFIQEQLKKAGIEAEIEVMESAPFWNLMLDLTQQPFEMFYMGRMGTFNDPILDWQTQFMCKAADNLYGYCNEKYDAAIETARQATSPEARAKAIAEAGKILDDDVAYLALVNGTQIYAVRADLMDAYPTAVRDMMRLERAYLR